MAFRYLIYSTGTTFSTTIVRESATDNPGVNEASLYSDFIIPIIQPLYLWRVTGGTTVVPNTDSNISNYLESIAPAPQPEDDATVGYVTGITSTKIDKVTGATGNIGTFVADGNLEDSGYAIADLTGGTSYTFVGSGGTQVVESGSDPTTVTIYSALPTGTTVNWGDITGTLSNQTDLQNALNAKLDVTLFNSYTGDTETAINNKLDSSIFNTYTGDTQPVIDAAITGATNGLSYSGRDIELGGALTKNTVISGTTFDLDINTKSISLQAINGIDIIDTDGIGGINIESDAGTISLIGNDNLSIEKTKLEISETSMIITDSRTGATRVGLVYNADYSATFTDESLITKRYADAVASGLIPKAAVLVATTGETIDLGTGGLLTVDGVTLQAGDRVLVKDNTDASQNGIYIAGSGAWTRSSDFDGNLDGEVSSGNLIPIVSGNTQYSTIWVLVTPNPITVGTTDLEFTLFSSPHELIAGTGINITGNVIDVDGASLAGNSISWTGNTFNVDTQSGTLSTALGSKLNITDFDIYSGTTVPATYLSIANFNTFTGTTLPANYYNKTEINSYTGTTDTRLDNIESDITFLSGATDNKLDTDVFTGYTASTASNEIFLIHTGGTELNTILATAIEWDSEVVGGSAFSWSGDSNILILETGAYELSYNVPFNVSNNSDMSVGSNVILNNATVIDVTASAGFADRNLAAGNISLPPVIINLTANDILTLATFRTAQSGSATSLQNGSILIKKKNTLQ